MSKVSNDRTPVNLDQSIMVQKSHLKESSYKKFIFKSPSDFSLLPWKSEFPGTENMYFYIIVFKRVTFAAVNIWLLPDASLWVLFLKFTNSHSCSVTSTTKPVISRDILTLLSFRFDENMMYLKLATDCFTPFLDCVW